MPGLGLAYLAVNVQQSAAALEGVDAALSALQHAPSEPGRPSPGIPDSHQAAVRREVVGQILALATNPTAAASLRSALFDRLANATSSPADEVVYQLAFGAFLASTGKTEEAIDQYQAVLADPTLSAQLYQQGTGSRQAGLEAKMRLAAVVKEAGPKIYERYETAAAQRLAGAMAAAPGPGGADRAGAAVPAVEVRAPPRRSPPPTRLAAGGDTNGAIAQFRAPTTGKPDQAMLQRTVGRLVELYTSTSHINEARHWLNRARRDHPGLQPLRDGQPVDVSAWLAELASRPSGQTPLPSLATPLSTSFVIPAQLLTPAAQPEQTWARDRIVTLIPGTPGIPASPGNLGIPATSGKVQLRRGPSLDAAWEADVPAGPVALLSLNQDQVVLWLDHDCVVSSLDAQSGKPLWQLDAKATLDEVGGQAQRQGERRPSSGGSSRYSTPACR